MASIKKRKSTFSVIYWYLDNAGERKQKWDTLETKKEAKQRKAFVEYYQEKYGTWRYGVNKLYLLIRKKEPNGKKY